MFRKNSLQVQRHVLRRGLKKFRNLRLCQPDRFVLKTALHARSAILGLVKDEFGLGQRIVTHGVASFCFIGFR